MRLSSWLFAALFAFGLVGCDSSPVNVVVSSFNRPGDVAFVCLQDDIDSDDDIPTFVALADCALPEDDSDDPETHSMIALVTQTAVGEVAAIDLRTGRALDSDVGVPGFTYRVVGESPSGLVTVEPSEDTPALVIVATRGERTIEVYDAAEFHPDVTPAEGFSSTEARLPAAPTSLVFVPSSVDESVAGLGTLIATMPELSALAVLPLSADGTVDIADLTTVTLDASAVGGAIGPLAVDEMAPWERVCPADRSWPLATVEAREPTDAGTPTPARVFVDAVADTPTLLVADEGLPIIHRFTIEGGVLTEGAGFNVAVPTLDVVATPEVARALTDDPIANADRIDQRYLYAIDATDGSILAVDYTEGSMDFGAVLAINAGEGPSDRVSYRSRASMLTVLAPGLAQAADGSSETPGLCPPSDEPRADDASPAALRGVFIAAALTTGSVGVIDIWDLDATCRGGEACENPEVDDDVEVGIRRHRPRIAAFADLPVAVGTTPTLTFESAAGRLDTAGNPTSGDGPGLTEITCLDTHILGFPREDEGFPRICVLQDHWAQANQRWLATYEGPMLDSRNAGGRFVEDGGTLRIDAATANHCAFGALGSDDVAAATLEEGAPEAGYAGDWVEIVSDVSVGHLDDPACADFLLPDDDSDRDRILLPLLEAHATSLVIDRDSAAVPAAQVDAILNCFDAPFSYRLRTREAYTVVAAFSLVPHRIAEGDDGRCFIDTETHPLDATDPATYRSFRALPGQTYVHPLVSFQITPITDEALATVQGNIDAQLIFDVSEVPSETFLTGGIVPVSMVWEDVFDDLFVSDAAGNVVRRINLNTVATEATFR